MAAPPLTLAFQYEQIPPPPIQFFLPLQPPPPPPIHQLPYIHHQIHTYNPQVMYNHDNLVSFSGFSDPNLCPSSNVFLDPGIREEILSSIASMQVDLKKMMGCCDRMEATLQKSEATLQKSEATLSQLLCKEELASDSEEDSDVVSNSGGNTVISRSTDLVVLDGDSDVHPVPVLHQKEDEMVAESFHDQISASSIQGITPMYSNSEAVREIQINRGTLSSGTGCELQKFEVINVFPVSSILIIDKKCWKQSEIIARNMTARNVGDNVVDMLPYENSFARIEDISKLVVTPDSRITLEGWPPPVVGSHSRNWCASPYFEITAFSTLDDINCSQDQDIGGLGNANKVLSVGNGAASLSVSVEEANGSVHHICWDEFTSAAGMSQKLVTVLAKRVPTQGNAIYCVHEVLSVGSILDTLSSCRLVNVKGFPNSRDENIQDLFYLYLCKECVQCFLQFKRGTKVMLTIQGDILCNSFGRLGKCMEFIIVSWLFLRCYVCVSIKREKLACVKIWFCLWCHVVTSHSPHHSSKGPFDMILVATAVGSSPCHGITRSPVYTSSFYYWEILTGISGASMKKGIWTVIKILSIVCGDASLGVSAEETNCWRGFYASPFNFLLWYEYAQVGHIFLHLYPWALNNSATSRGKQLVHGFILIPRLHNWYVLSMVEFVRLYDEWVAIMLYTSPWFVTAVRVPLRSSNEITPVHISSACTGIIFWLKVTHILLERTLVDSTFESSSQWYLCSRTRCSVRSDASTVSHSGQFGIDIDYYFRSNVLPLNLGCTNDVMWCYNPSILLQGFNSVFEVCYGALIVPFSTWWYRINCLLIVQTQFGGKLRVLGQAYIEQLVQQHFDSVLVPFYIIYMAHVVVGGPTVGPQCIYIIISPFKFLNMVEWSTSDDIIKLKVVLLYPGGDAFEVSDSDYSIFEDLYQHRMGTIQTAVVGNPLTFMLISTAWSHPIDLHQEGVQLRHNQTCSLYDFLSVGMLGVTLEAATHPLMRVTVGMQTISQLFSRVWMLLQWKNGIIWFKHAGEESQLPKCKAMVFVSEGTLRTFIWRIAWFLFDIEGAFSLDP